MVLSENDYKIALSCTISKTKLLSSGLALERRQDRKDDPLGKMMFNLYFRDKYRRRLLHTLAAKLATI